MNTLIKNLTGIHGQSTATDIRLSGNVISEIGKELIPQEGEKLIEARGCVAYPGFVNTHHHLAQSVLKGIPAGVNQPLGEWLASVPYRYWPKIEPELMYCAAKLGLYELLRSGTTSCADHHYLYHLNSSDELEAAVWQAADDLGIRLTLCRGGANVFGSHKGLKDAGIQPETLEQTLTRLEASRSRYHQPAPDGMRKLVVAPTSLIHSQTQDQLKALAHYGRSHQLRLHSHLLEVGFDEQQALAQHQLSAIDYAEQCDWLGEDVWFAHLVQTDQQGIEKLAKTKTGIAHCPTSNCRLGSGIAPLIEMHNAGMPISIGVDGSASSESASMIQEANLAWLLHRATHGASATSLEQVTHWASKGGANILGYDNLGELVVGQLADLVLYRIDALRYSGVHDPLNAPVMLGEPAQVEHSWINGNPVVQQGKVLNLDETELKNNVRLELNKLIAKVN